MSNETLFYDNEGSYWPNGKTKCVILPNKVSVLFCYLINATVYHLDEYEPLSFSIKELNGWANRRNPDDLIYPKPTNFSRFLKFLQFSQKFRFHNKQN